MFTRFIPVVLALAVAAIGAAVPSQPERRLGPSGTIVEPVGGTEYTYAPGQVMQDYPNAGIHFVYNQAYSPTVYTDAVDLYLEPWEGLTKTGATYMISNGTQGLLTAQMNYTFGFPHDACGTFDLVVIEHQNYEGQRISFRSAAPKIIISCRPPVTLPPGNPSSSGTLNQPIDGAILFNDYTSQRDVYVEYARAQSTSYISLSLKPADSEGNEVSGTTYDLVRKLVVAEWSTDAEPGSLMEYFFLPPPEACGYYRLVVVEHQPTVSFRSAAPLVQIQCS